MAELIADLFVSLDGFAHGVDAGPFFDHSGPELDGWVRENLDRPQRLLMGRVTYEALAGISTTATDENSTRMSALPKFVVSNTLQEPLSWANTRLVRGDPAEAVGALKRDAGEPLRTIGSLTLVRGLMERGLVDRLRLMIFPLVLGDAGREPIFAAHGRAGLDLAGTRVLDSRLVLLEYRPLNGSGPT